MSFTIKCDKCGVEQKLTQENSDQFYRNEKISLHQESYSDTGISIYCECGCEL